MYIKYPTRETYHNLPENRFKEKDCHEELFWEA